MMLLETSNPSETESKTASFKTEVEVNLIPDMTCVRSNEIIHQFVRQDTLTTKASVPWASMPFW